MNKRHPFTLLLFISISLSACSHLRTSLDTHFYGESAADLETRADIKKRIEMSLSTWHGDRCQKIDRIDSKITSVQQTERGDTEKVLENWTVSACHIRKNYLIGLYPDIQGDFDFSIRFPPT
jgi:hypothetical protein